MDGVIFDAEKIWIEVHRVFGTLEEGIRLTNKLLDTDYEKLVDEVVKKLWLGKDAQPFFELIDSLQYVPGIHKLVSWAKEQEMMVVVISGGSTHAALRASKEMDFDIIFANHLGITDGKVDGDFWFPVGEGKKEKKAIIANLKEELGLKQEEVAFIGDTRRDLGAFSECGTRIAFHSEQDDFKEAATHVIDEFDVSKAIPILKNI